jgi:CRP-like cAMP-binding protein
VSVSEPISPSPANRLLAALPSREYGKLHAHFEPFPLTARAVLYEPGQSPAHVYFPGSGVLSQLVLMNAGGRIEVGMVGSEGMAGLPVVLGADTNPAQCVVQVAGEALRMEAAVFRSQVGRDSLLYHLLLRYAHAFFNQLCRSVACNSLHSVEQRCCRWLLLTHNRAGTDHFPFTHELLAGMLGVRRASVSEVARLLQRAKLIRYQRGQLTILDRRGLEAVACECYHATEAEFDRLRATLPTT